MLYVGPSVRAAKVVVLWPLTCWDCGFELLGGRRCSSVLSVVCYQKEVSASG
jgi:hypothetical protein